MLCMLLGIKCSLFCMFLHGSLLHSIHLTLHIPMDLGTLLVKICRMPKSRWVCSTHAGEAEILFLSCFLIKTLISNEGYSRIMRKVQENGPFQVKTTQDRTQVNSTAKHWEAENAGVQSPYPSHFCHCPLCPTPPCPVSSSEPESDPGISPSPHIYASFQSFPPSTPVPLLSFWGSNCTHNLIHTSFQRYTPPWVCRGDWFQHPQQISASAEAQAPHGKWRSPVCPSYPQMGNPWIPKTDCICILETSGKC